jgi:N-acetylglutamate synthase-like GNAT family acetyltransferase
MEKMVFEVRRAVEGDIPEIQEITREAFKMYMEGAGIVGSLAALKETYEDIKKDIETKLVFVAILDNKVVGSVRVELMPDKTAYLSRLGVAKENQSHGVGRVLMNVVDKAMMKLGVTNLYLHTASRLLSLVRFYYGRGFYIESTANDRGYIRALLCKEYETAVKEDSLNVSYNNFAVV